MLGRGVVLFVGLDSEFVGVVVVVSRVLMLIVVVCCAGVSHRYADDGDAELVCEVEHFCFVDHDDIADGECEASSSGGVEVSDGVRADGWDVAAPVVACACAFAECPA